MKRKFLAFLLAFVMIVGMLPMAALAEAADDTSTTAAATALPAVGEDGKITLTGDVTLAANAEVEGKEIVPDGNTIIVPNGVTLTLNNVTMKHTWAEDHGMNTNSEDQPFFIVVQKGGTLNISGGTYESNLPRMIDVQGEAVISDATIKCNIGTDKSFDSEPVIEVSNASGEPNGDAKLTIPSGSITVEAADGAKDCAPCCVAAFYGATLILGDETEHTGPTFSGGFFTIAFNYTQAPVHVKIHGGTYTSKYYASGSVDYFNSVLYMSAGGDYEITGGEFTPATVPSGTNVATLTLRYKNAAINLDVSGGTFKGDPVFYPTSKQVEVTGGTGSHTISITGGTFSSNPSDYVPTTHKATEESGTWTVTEKETVTVSGVKFSIPTNVTLGGDTKLVDTAVTTLTPDENNVITVPTLKAEYIQNWTAFNDTEVSEQNGNFLPLKIALPDGTTRDAIAEVKVIGSKTKTWTGEQFFTEDEGKSETLIMQLNKLVGNEGEDEGKTGMKDGHFQIVITPKATEGDIAQATTYDIDCTGVILKLPAAPESTKDTETGGSKIVFTTDEAKQEAANVTNIINAVKAPNDADASDADGVVTGRDTATIAYTATTEGSDAKTGTVTLPTDVSKALQQKDSEGNPPAAADKIDVKVDVVTDAATVTLSSEAIDKLSSADPTVIKAEPKTNSELNITDTDSAALVEHVGNGVDVTVKANDTDLITSSDPLPDDGALEITMKVATAPGESVHILYLNATNNKFELIGTYTVDANGCVTFKVKHLCEFYEVASNSTTDPLVGNLTKSENTPKKLALEFSGTGAFRTATVKNLAASSKCTVQVCREANAAPAVIFVLDANASGTATFQVNAGSVVTVWKGVLTFDSATGNPNNAEDVEHVTETAQ